MSERAGQPTEALFEASPCPAIIYDLAAETGSRPNIAARELLEGDDGRSSALLAGLARRAREEQEPLRWARLVLPHLPERIFQAHALHLGTDHSALMLEDVTEAFIRRQALSVWTDALDRVESAFVVCAAPRAQLDVRRLEVIGSNARAHLLAGLDRLPPETRLGEVLGDVLDEDDFERLRALLMQGGASDLTVSWRIERADRVWSCHAWLVDRRLSVRLDDVSEKGHLARALSDHARLLRAANEEIDEINFILREHLRDPVREADRLAHRVAEQAPLDGATREVRRLSHVVDHVERTLDDLLAYIAITRSPLTGGTIDLETVLERVLITLEPRLRANGLIVTHGPLPTVWGQERLFETLLTQLILDGVRGPGRGAETVHFEAERRDTSWHITVRNQRPVAELELAETLLQVGRSGQGMGLAICRRIVEHHGGAIGVDIRNDEAVIWLELPSTRFR